MNYTWHLSSIASDASYAPIDTSVPTHACSLLHIKISMTMIRLKMYSQNYVSVQSEIGNTLSSQVFSNVLSIVPSSMNIHNL